MALAVKISSFVSAGYTNPVRWDLYEAGTNIIVDTHSEAGPHGQVYNFSFTNNIKDIVYTVKMYEETGGPGTLIKSHDVTVSTQTLEFDADIILIVGGGEAYDPVADTDTVIVPATIGKDCYLVQRAFGQLLETRIPEVQRDEVTGEFKLLNGVLFEPDDIYIVKFRPKVVINPPGTQSPTLIYKDVVLVTEDITLTSSDFGKLYIVDGMLPVVTITLPLIDDTIEKVPLFIESVGTTHNNVVIKAAVGDTIKSLGTTSNTFILGKAEKGQLIKLGSSLYGFTDSIDIKRAGMLDWGYKVGINRLWANGAEYNVADYPRLKKAMDSLVAGQVVSYATWGASVIVNGVTVYPSKGYFAISNDNLKFKVPDFRNMSVRALRYSDNTVDDQRLAQLAGGYQHHLVSEHDHFIVHNNANNGGNDYATRGHLSGGNSGYDLYGSQTPPNFFKTSKTGTGIGAETRGSNIGMIPLIIF